MKKYLAIFCVVILVVASCRKPDQYPNIPELTFKSLEFGEGDFGPTFTLTATFTDGDGDVGYYKDKENGDIYDLESSPYYFNLTIQMFRLKNGVWTDTIHFRRPNEVQEYDATFFSFHRLPYMTPDGKNKGLKGDIYKTDDFLLGINDTIRFEAFIYDRALHKSNVITTPAYFIQIP